MGKTRDTSSIYSLGKKSHCFACRLQHVLTLTALGTDPENYQKDYTQRQTDFLTCIINPRDERITYDLRFISDPNPSLYTKGRITVALLCRMENVSAREAKRYAYDLLHLLDAHFEEYAFELMGASEVPGLLEPFPIENLLNISRRASRERLDTLQSGQQRRQLGFKKAEARVRKVKMPADTIFHIFPFLVTFAPMNSLFKLFLLGKSPVAFSARLQPTALRPAEEAFFESQIAQCERYAQVQIGRPPEDLSSLWPTLKEQAQIYKRYQTKLFFGLKDNAALMTLEIASPKRIPKPLLDNLGTMITDPAGWKQTASSESSHDYLAGGYELFDQSNDSEAVRAFERLQMKIVPHPLAPPGADRMLNIFDSIEAAAAFRLPPATMEPQLGLDAQDWRTYPAPRELPDEGSLIGVSFHDGMEQPIRIGPEDRRRHVYIVGQTGTGKTTLVKTMILEDMEAGHGLCVIDPHGDLFNELMGKVPKERVEDVVLLDPTDVQYPVGLNMLEYETETQRHFLVQELVGIVTRLIEDEYGVGSAGQFAGPLFFQHMRMNLLLAMSNVDDPGTLLEFYTIYQENSFWRRWLPLRLRDPLLERWVNQVLPRTSYTEAARDGVTMGGYIGSKFEGFVFDPMLRHVFGQKRSTINIREIMDQGKILLVNLAKGELTEANARFLGMVLIAKILAAAMGRVRVHERDRPEFHLYVDEFQSLATQSFITLLAEARKFGLSLVLANQFLSQVKDQRIVEAIFGNVGTIICFRLGQADARLMEREFSPVITRSGLINLPNWQACMTTLIHGQTVRPFSLHTLQNPTPFKKTRATAVRRWSRKMYGRPRKKVEDEIAKGLQEPLSDHQKKDRRKRR